MYQSLNQPTAPGWEVPWSAELERRLQDSRVEFDFWAKGFEGGPLQISADGGQTMLALFEAGEGHQMIPQKTGVAFSIDPEDFMVFARSLPCGIDSPSGQPLRISDIIDFDMC